MKTVADKEDLDQSGAIRKLLATALIEWKKNYAVEQYRQGKFSFGQASKFAEISVWELPQLLKDKKVPLNYSLESLKKDFESL